MRRIRLSAVALVLLAATFLKPAAGEELGLKVPAGFEVSLYAGDDLAHDIYSMTLDARGRVVVAGAGYIKVLHDDNGDGRADRATVFSRVPKSGAHGLCFDGPDLICTGDDSVMRLRDTDGDGEADGEIERWAKLRHSEHGANGIVQGPDGWFYLICGNDSGVTKEHAATPTSPIREPQSGALVRISPDGKQTEVVAHGFRNPYDLDFGPLGNCFTVDSDGERDHHLPWYVPTRLFDIAQGMHHGWVLQGHIRSWSRPASFFDNVPPVAFIGRGSPTGVAVYRHYEFPAEYRNNVFSCCWTLGRVHRFSLHEREDSFKATPETFLETTGEVGFAPVDIAVGKYGEMFVAIGGRRTRGSVFRVKYVGERPSAEYFESLGLKADALSLVLQSPQPQAAWSRAEWVPAAKKLGRQAFVDAISEKRRTEELVRSVEIVTELFGGFKPAEIETVVDKMDAQTVARIAWSIGRTMKTKEGGRLLEQIARKEESVIQRAVWSAMLEMPPDTLFTGESPPQVLGGGNGQIGRFTHAAAVMRSGVEKLKIQDREINIADDVEYLGAGGKLKPEHFERCADLFLAAVESPRSRRRILPAIRLMQLALGDINLQAQAQEVRAGYSANLDRAERDRVTSSRRTKLAAAIERVNRDERAELARLLAMLEADDSALQDRIAANFRSSPQDDLHYLIVLSCLPGKRSGFTTERTAEALAGLHAKMRKLEQYASRNWPARVGELVERLIEVDPQLPAELLEQESFREPEQAAFAQKFPLDQKVAAARKLVNIARKAGPEEPRWTPSLLDLAQALPREEALPLWREAAADFALRDQAVGYLAKAPLEEDRPHFLAGLESIQSATVAASAGALARIKIAPKDEDFVSVLAALRQACLAPDAKDARQNLVALLQAWTRQPFVIEEKKGADLTAAYRTCADWFTENRPAVAAKLRAFAGDAAEWKQRLTAVDWEQGSATRGKVVFEKRACVRCHSGTGPLGPDLAGAAGRFSREDLFAAVIEPSKDVAPAYQTTQVVTGGGRIYHGLVVYESPDGTLLQTGADTTVRIAGDEIIALKKSKVSLMPTGLLNGATEGELADLYAYLRTLKPAK